MKKILLFSTGGTIEMLPENGGITIGAVSGLDIKGIKALPEANITIRKYCNLPSPHITPAIMADIARELKKIEISHEFDGVVVTHGTDTLEETAFLADVFLEGTLPVVFTAAMRSSSELGVDGPRNIRSAVKVACGEQENIGVTVVLNDEIHAAGRVTKTCTSNVSSFDSPGYGPLGFVDDDKAIFHRKPIWRMNLPCKELKLEERVALVRLAAGFGEDIIDFCTKKGYKAIVVEAFGRGNVPPKVVDSIERAIIAGVLVTVSSRCHEGRVLGVYGYCGGGIDLLDRGVLFAGDMAGNKIRLFLMACLGTGMNKISIKALFDNL